MYCTAALRDNPASMSAPTAPRDDRAARDPARVLRYVVRVPLLLLHLLVSLPLTLLAITPLFAWLRMPSGEAFHHRMIRWWSATLVRIFGIEVVRHGESAPGAVLLVANHRSWLDIELIHSQRMACFVAKSEIAGWPAIGWLASRAGTIYHRRGSTESLASVSAVMVSRLRAGLAVAVFPEGGIRGGDRVHTFHARIFQAAIDAGAPSQPVALRFTRGGEPTDVLAQGEGESFFGSFFRLLGEARTRAEVMFLTPVPPAAGERRRMAEACRAQIVAALGQREPAPGEAPSDDLDPIASGDADAAG